KLLWGDTHLHTRLSMDAYALGNRSGDADTAYRFAKGEPVIHPYHRARVQLQTPLDFLAVADHAELLGAPYALLELKDKRLTQTRVGKRLIKMINDGKGLEAFGLIVLGGNLADMPDDKRPPKIGLGTALLWRFQDLYSVPNKRARAERWLASDPSLLRDLDNDEITKTMWASNMDAAAHHNNPGKFTTLVGWEYSSVPSGANLHRVVLSPTDPETAKSWLPYSTIDSPNPETLWRWLEETKKRTGADFIAIPHNSNISKGRMYASVDYDGRPLTAEYAKLRSTWETIAEVTQIKGTSETHPVLSPNDEFANFELYQKLIENRADAQHDATPTNGDYVRGALKSGLEIENAVGVNPFKYGMIGSTDGHTGLPSAEENNFMGKFVLDSTPEMKENSGGRGTGWIMSTSGLAAVWARENTREEIFAAMKRREVYGTTGPRISVRFFGGFGFVPEDAGALDIAAVGYAKGVPMGGDLTAATAAPSFLVQAVKDPKDGNLDRVQIVKGWLGADGKAQEKVFDIAWSGERAPGPDGKLPPVGNSVDVETAHYTNSIGAPELTTVWTDPEFTPAARAFYYVRVLQIPTPRNSLYDSIALQKAPPEGYPTAIQERAYTSPIWYSPS
ncbi:MAG: DUF3604 domain-containing protein, partial [Pseudomonadota bacterium]